MKIIAALCLFLAAVFGTEARELTLGAFSREARCAIEQKIRRALAESKVGGEVTGTVTFAAEDHFFIQNDDDGLKIVIDESAAGEAPAVGDVTAVKGAPVLDGGRVVLLARSWRKVGREALPEPVPAAYADLTYGGEEKGVNGRRVEVCGRAIGVTENGFAIRIDSELPVNVILPKPPAFIADCERTHPKVKVRGVAELMLDQSALFTGSRYVMGVKLNVCSADDVTLAPDILYLSNIREGRWVVVRWAVLGVLLAGLLAGAVLLSRQRRGLFRTRTVMAERKRMADDLHDTIEQHLVGAGMFLKLNRIKEAEEILVRAKREMRDIVWGLKNDDMMRQTPTEMIRAFARDENRKGIYRVDTRLEGLPAHLEAGAMRDLSLVIREAIGNAIKHGGAKKIAIASDGNGENWTIRIANDGAPFDPATAPGPSEGHFGVEGMRQRARRFGATIDFTQKKGWMIMEISKCQ